MAPIPTAHESGRPVLLHPSEANDLADTYLRRASGDERAGVAAAFALVSIAASLRNVVFSLHHISTNTRKENR